jgi:hypothetical protein
LTWGGVLFRAYSAYDRDEVLAGSNGRRPNAALVRDRFAAVLNRSSQIVDGEEQAEEG